MPKTAATKFPRELTQARKHLHRAMELLRNSTCFHSQRVLIPMIWADALLNPKPPVFGAWGGLQTDADRRTEFRARRIARRKLERNS